MPDSQLSVPGDLFLIVLFLYLRIKRNAAVQRRIPATTVDTTMTTMLVPRLSDPIPPLFASLAAVLAGPRPSVGSPVSNLRLIVSSEFGALVSVIRVTVELCLASGDGWLSGRLVVVDMEVAVIVLAVLVLVVLVTGGGGGGGGGWMDVATIRGSDSVFASLRPGVRGCVSSKVRSASTHLIWIAGPTVTRASRVVASRAKPHTPPRKSVTSVVQVSPIGTQYTAVSPGAMAGNPSAVRVLVIPQLGPTTKPRGQMAGE